MSLLTQQTSVNPGQFYFVKADGQQLNISTINANTINANTMSSNSIGTSSLTADFLSTIDLYASQGTISTFSTSQIVIDSQTLNATPTELLLNGIPVATQSSLSSIADWSLDPAISTVQMDGFDLNQAGLVSSLNVRAGNGLFNNLVAFNSLFVSSNTSTISSLIVSAEVGNFSSIVAGDISANSISCELGNFDFFLKTNRLDMPPGQRIILENGGASYVSPGSAAILFNYDIVGAQGTHMFFDTTISSVRFRGFNGGSYDDNIPAKVFIQDLTASTFNASSILVSGLISTPDIEVSTINGASFGASSINVNVVGVSSLVANSISSIGAEIRQALISTIVFSPSLNPSLGGVNVNLGLGGILGNVIGWGAGVFGAATGAVGLITGITALATGRQSEYLDNSRYELVNGTTQLQFSTLGQTFSTIYRLNSSADPQRIPGEEILISTINPPGLAVRSVSDPLYTLSTPNSTIQAFGEWVPVPEELVNTSTFTTASISSLSVSSINGLNTASLENISTFNDLAASTIYTSSISTAYIYGANPNLFGLGIQGLEIQTAPTGQVWISSPQTNIAGLTNASTLTALQVQGRTGFISTANISSAFVSTLAVAGLSSIVFSTSGTAGTASQPAGRLIISGNDLDLGQQDLWVQQVRVGAGNPSGSAQTEVIWYSPDNLTTRGLGLGGADLTIRLQSTLNSGTNNGYLLDTTINKPFFSTINNSTCMMATIPSTSLGVFGVSTLAVIPPIQVYGGFYSSTTQVVAGANTITPLTYTSESVNVGGITFAGSTITAPIAGTYEITHSIQFDTSSGGTNEVSFWFKKNGTDIAQSASIVSVVNNGETLGTISLLDTAAAGDQYAVCIASADANMSAAAFAISSFRPAIPSLITNIKRL